MMIINGFKFLFQAIFGKANSPPPVDVNDHDNENGLVNENHLVDDFDNDDEDGFVNYDDEDEDENVPMSGTDNILDDDDENGLNTDDTPMPDVEGATTEPAFSPIRKLKSFRTVSPDQPNDGDDRDGFGDEENPTKEDDSNDDDGDDIVDFENDGKPTKEDHSKDDDTMECENKDHSNGDQDHSNGDQDDEERPPKEDHSNDDDAMEFDKDGSFDIANDANEDAEAEENEQPPKEDDSKDNDVMECEKEDHSNDDDVIECDKDGSFDLTNSDSDDDEEEDDEDKAKKDDMPTLDEFLAAYQQGDQTSQPELAALLIDLPNEDEDGDDDGDYEDDQDDDDDDDEDEDYKDDDEDDDDDDNDDEEDDQDAAEDDESTDQPRTRRFGPEPPPKKKRKLNDRFIRNSKCIRTKWKIQVRMKFDKSRNGHLERLVIAAAQEVTQYTIDHNAHFNPTNPYATPNLVQLRKTKGTHNVYAVTSSHEPFLIEKIGQSAKLLNRYDSPILYRTVVIINSLLIKADLNLKIYNRLKKLLTDIAEHPLIHYDYRRFAHTLIHRGADAIGLMKTMYWQIIEIGCQDRYGTRIPPAECFSTNEVLQDQRRKIIEELFNEWKADFEPFRGKEIEMMDTWPTGRKEHILSSQKCANDFVMGGRPWDDAVEKPVVRNAKNTKELYSTAWSDEVNEESKERVRDKVVWAVLFEKVLFLAKNQTRLFPGESLLIELQEQMGLVVIRTLGDKKNPNRLVVLVDKEQKAMVILYHPLGYAMDSRKCTQRKVPSKIRSFMEMQLMKKLVEYLSGNETIQFDTSEGDDCLTAAFFFEMVLIGCHGFPRHAAAVARDALTPDDVYACRQNDLAKVQSEDRLPNIAERVRRAAYSAPSTTRPLDKGIIWQAVCILSHATCPVSLKNAILAIKRLFAADGKSPNTISARWKALFGPDYMKADTEFLRQCREYHDTYVVKNRGNRSTNRQPTTKARTTDNKERIARLCESEETFIICPKPPPPDHPIWKFQVCSDPTMTEDYANCALFREHEWVPPTALSKTGMTEYQKPSRRAKEDLVGDKKIQKVQEIVCIFLDIGRLEEAPTDAETDTADMDADGAFVLEICKYGVKQNGGRSNGGRSNAGRRSNGRRSNGRRSNNEREWNEDDEDSNDDKNTNEDPWDSDQESESSEEEEEEWCEDDY